MVLSPVRAFVVFMSVAVTLPLLAQSIRTVAGGGIDDGRPAKQASLAGVPSGIAVDTDGNVFVSDELRHHVRQIDVVTGIITTVVGTGFAGFSGDGGPADEAQINGPTGLAFDSSGRLYVADRANRRIRRVDFGRNVIETYAGDPDAGILDEGADRLRTRLALSEANGIVVASNGDLFYADQPANVVRRIDAATGAVLTVAGNFTKGFDGDGSGTQRMLDEPVGVTLTPQEDVLIFSDRGNVRLRRLDLTTGMLTTISGDGSAGGDPDGTQTNEPLLAFVQGVGYDRNGLLHIAGFDADGNGYIASVESSVYRTLVGRAGAAGVADGAHPREGALRTAWGVAFGPSNQLYAISSSLLTETTPDRQSITIRAGEAKRVGDGGPATGAIIDRPSDVAVDGDGHIYLGELVVNESNIRRVDAATGTISTVASDLELATSVDADSLDRVHFPSGNRLARHDPATGAIEALAGGGENRDDRVPAFEAKFELISSIGVAPDDSVYVGDGGRFGVFRFDPLAGEVTRVAGQGTGEEGAGYSGDGGPATQARIGVPSAVDVAEDGTLFIADQGCTCVRRVDALTGLITTAAGGGTDDGEDVPAANAFFHGLSGVTVDGDGSLFVSTPDDGKIRKVGATGLVRTIAGGRLGYDGDGGPALGAGIGRAAGLQVTPDGSVLFADESANRVRAVLPCVEVAAPRLSSPQRNATVDSGGVLFAWEDAEGAQLYDVLLTEGENPERTVAASLEGTSHLVSNLRPGVTYSWRVEASGDPHCSPGRATSSMPSSFETRAACEAPGFFQLIGPPPQAVSGGEVDLSWTPAAGADRYEVFLGVSTPLSSIGVTGETSFRARNLAPASTYFWAVRAHSSCDAAFSRGTDTGIFVTDGACQAPDTPHLISPSAGDAADPGRVTLVWSPVAGAAGYDVRLGRISDSELVIHGVTGKSVSMTGLERGTEYTWRVEAFAGCDSSSRTTSEVQRFVTSSCVTPRVPNVVSPVIESVARGRPYVVSWGDVAHGDASTSFVVERSRDGFASVFDRQSAYGTSVTFTADESGTWSHRVIALACDGAAQSAPSRVVRVVAEEPSGEVRILVPPRGILVRRGAALKGHVTSVTLENAGEDALDLSFVPSSFDGAPFFEMVDPYRGVIADFHLDAGERRKYLISFSGPSTAIEASYAGLLDIVRQDGTPLRDPVSTYVSLRVGARGTSVPDILDAGGTPTAFVSFPASADPVEQTASVTVQLRNTGDTALDLAADVSPYAWLEPEAGWNASPIPAGATRSVRLLSRRERAPRSAAPRQAFVRFRNAGGAAATVLVEDPDAVASTPGRIGGVGTSRLSRIVTRVTSVDLGEGRILATSLRLMNWEADPVEIDLAFTPEGAGGFDASRVQTVSLTVPGHDTVSVVDPLVTWFGRARPATGQLEIRTAADRYGSLAVNAREGVLQTDSISREIPVVAGGDGASADLHHFLSLPEAPSGVPRILLVETSGSTATGRVEIVDGGGIVVAALDVSLPPNAYRVLDASAFSLGSLPIPLYVVVSATAGVVYPAVLVESPEGSVIVPSVPLREPSAAKQRAGSQDTARWIVPFVAHGSLAGVSSVPLRTTLTFMAAGTAPAQFRVRLMTAEGSGGVANVTVEPRRPRAFGNVFTQLFGKSIDRGSIVVELLSGNGRVAGIGIAVDEESDETRLTSLPVMRLAEGAGAQPPEFIEGIDQTLDPNRGRRWSLYLTESAGATASVKVSLYEDSRSLAPLASKVVEVGSESQVEIADLIEAMGLNEPDRRADRPQMLCVVTHMGGDGRISAVSMSTDRITSFVQAHLLTSRGGEQDNETATRIKVLDRLDRRRGIRR